MWFEEHIPLDFNFHTAQVHLNDFLSRLRRDQKLYKEIEDIDPHIDIGPLTNNDLLLAMKVKKEKELLKPQELRGMLALKWMKRKRLRKRCKNDTGVVSGCCCIW